jgi:ribosomal protein S18 acetylase RimI-like enzyme
VNRTQLAPGAQPGGRTVEIRAATAADCEAIRSFVCGLSLRARFLRFFTPAAPPSPAVLRRMCAVGRSTDALVATEDGVVIGHAMAVDVIGPDAGRVADIGLVVTDQWQDRGIGSEMLRQVVARAAGRGVRGLVMEVLPENRQMLAMISRRWAGAGYEFGGGSVTIRVRLPDPHGEAGSAATAGLPARADGPRGGWGGSSPRANTAQLEYRASMTSAYLACTTRRLSFRVGVSSSLSAVHSTGSRRHLLTC